MNDWNNIESSNIDGYDNGFEWLYDYQQRIVNQELNDEMFMSRFQAHPESASSFSNVNPAISMLPLGPLPPVATNVSNSIYPLNNHSSSASSFCLASSFNSDVTTTNNSNNHGNNNGNGNNYDICTLGEEKNLLELGKEKPSEVKHEPSIQANYNLDRDLNRSVCNCPAYLCNESMMSKTAITSQASSNQNKIKDYYTSQAIGYSAPKLNEAKNVQPLDLSQRPMLANYFIYSNASSFTYPNSSFIASSSTPNVKTFADLKVSTNPIQGQRAIQSKSELRFNFNSSSNHQPVTNLNQCCNYRLIQGSRDVIVVPPNYTRFINFGNIVQPMTVNARLNTNQLGTTNCQFATLMPTKIVNKYELNANDQNAINQENYFTNSYSNIIPNGVFNINLNNEKHIEYNMVPNNSVPINSFNDKVIVPAVQIPVTRKRGRGRAKSSCNTSDQSVQRSTLMPNKSDLLVKKEARSKHFHVEEFRIGLFKVFSSVNEKKNYSTQLKVIFSQRRFIYEFQYHHCNMNTKSITSSNPVSDLTTCSSLGSPSSSIPSPQLSDSSCSPTSSRASSTTPTSASMSPSYNNCCCCSNDDNDNKVNLNNNSNCRQLRHQMFYAILVPFDSITGLNIIGHTVYVTVNRSPCIFGGSASQSKFTFERLPNLDPSLEELKNNDLHIIVIRQSQIDRLKLCLIEFDSRFKQLLSCPIDINPHAHMCKLPDGQLETENNPKLTNDDPIKSVNFLEPSKSREQSCSFSKRIKLN